MVAVEKLWALALHLHEAKETEARAVAARRKVEDEIVKLSGIKPDDEGTSTVSAQEARIKIVGRMNRKVDGDKLQEIAAENGLTEYLSKLFRWKPELSMSAWKAASKDITQPLSAAITTTPGRPSVSVSFEKKEQE